MEKKKEEEEEDFQTTSSGEEVAEITSRLRLRTQRKQEKKKENCYHSELGFPQAAKCN